MKSSPKYSRKSHNQCHDFTSWLKRVKISTGTKCITCSSYLSYYFTNYWFKKGNDELSWRKPLWVFFLKRVAYLLLLSTRNHLFLGSVEFKNCCYPSAVFSIHFYFTWFFYSFLVTPVFLKIDTYMQQEF